MCLISNMDIEYDYLLFKIGFTNISLLYEEETSSNIGHSIFLKYQRDGHHSYSLMYD